MLRSLKLRLRTRNGVAVAPVSPGLYPALARYRPDVILCEGPSNLPNNVIAWIYSWFHGVAMVEWGLGAVKGRTPSRLRGLVQPLIAAFERRMDAVVAYSRRGARYYEEIGLPSERIIVATNVVDTDARRAQIDRLDADRLRIEAHEKTDFIVLFVGALTAEKRVDLLIEGFGRIAGHEDESGRLPRLWIVGDGPARKTLEQRAAPLGDCVRFFGRVTDGVSRLFLAADVFVLPGLGGLAVSDAMVHGLPVIASIGDGAEADLVSPDVGYLDEDLDADRLAGYLVELRRDPALRKRLAQGAVERIEGGANMESYVESLHAAVRQAIVHRRSG